MARSKTDAGDRTSATAPTSEITLGPEGAPDRGDPAGSPASAPAIPAIFRRAWYRFLPPLLLVAFTVWLAMTQADNGVWISAGTDFLYLAVAGLGLNLLAGYTGQLSLGHAAFLLLGGYASLWAVEWGWSPYLAFPLAFVVGGVAGTVLALLCCHLRGFYLTAVTYGFGLVIGRIVTAPLFSAIFGGQPRRLNVGFADIPRFDGVPGAKLADLPRNQNRLGVYFIALLLLLVTVFLVRNLAESRWGRAFKSIRDSEIAARSSGVAVYGTKVVAFALSAAIVAMAGVIPVMLSQTADLQIAGQDNSFRLVTFLVIGGLGTVAGPIIGAFGPTFFLSIDWVKQHFGSISSLLFGIGALVTVATQPEGAMGAYRKNWSDWKRKRAAKGRPVASRPAPTVRAELMVPRPRGSDLGDVPVLEVKGLGKRFGGLAALSDLDIVVKRGTVHALIGPNGSGKSTFVNVVTGFYTASEGEITVQGKAVGGLKTHERSRLGMARTFQNLQVWRRMTVVENVMVGLHDRVRIGLIPSLLGLGFGKEKVARERAWGLLHFVGLEEKGRQAAGTLAFADQRRLEVARALASDPDLLLLDEPAAGMHPSEIRDLVGLIHKVREAGVTVLLIEHHMDLVMGLSDTITVLDYGRKIAEGTPAAVRADSRVIEAYLGADHA